MALGSATVAGVAAGAAVGAIEAIDGTAGFSVADGPKLKENVGFSVYEVPCAAFPDSAFGTPNVKVGAFAAGAS